MPGIKFDARDYGYTIISRFEKLLRDMCYKEFSSNFRCEDVIPQGVKLASEKRLTIINDLDELLENIEFIHLKEIVIYKNNYFLFYNVDTLSKSSFINTMDSLYNLRCKIAHIRDYFTNTDLNCLVNEVKLLTSKMKYVNTNMLNFIDTLLTNPGTLIEKVPLDFFSEETKTYDIINNIPVADYEYEGGFVGREDDKEKIIKMLQAHRVVTIAGAGGVGKSALALKIVSDIITTKAINYECVIWVSAKENKLTYLGIEDIEPTLQSYEELLDTILSVMGFNVNDYSQIEDKEHDINLLFDSCEKVLLVIDNLETIRDERIINFILDSHPKASILITSRRGLGQVERRHELKELKEREAIKLFRIICKEKNLKGLLSLEENTIKHYVNKLYCYPLAIKWVLGMVAVGKDITKVIENINESSSDISKFCFQQIYTDLSMEAKVLLCTLTLYEDAVSKGILKYISNLNEVIFEDSIESLILVSLIIPEQTVNKENQEINTYFSLLPLTRGYVKSQLDDDSGLKRRIQERMLTVDSTLEEAERAKNQYRFSLSNLGAITEEEKVAAMLVQTGYQKYQAGNYLDAVESYKKAIEIAPRFASIYRNWAIMESMEMNWVEADKLMDKASKLSPNDTQIWLAWGNMKRKNDKIKDAYNYYCKAYELSPNDNVVMNSLAKALSRLGEYERANDLLNQALNLVEGTPHNKHLIINYTCIADNLKRWAEIYSTERNYSRAEELLNEAIKDIEIVIALENSDSRSSILYREILIDLAYIKRNQMDINTAIELFRKVLDMPTKKYKEMEVNARAILGILDTYVKNGDIINANEMIKKDFDKIFKRIGKSTIIEKYNTLKKEILDLENKVFGKIIRVNIEKKYIIIENTNCPGETFITFANEFKEYINLDDDLLEKNVIFIPERDCTRRYAKNVQVI